MTLYVACAKCSQRARSTGALLHYGFSDVSRIKQAFALQCPNIPQEVSPVGTTASMLCPMAAARREEKIALMKRMAG